MAVLPAKPAWISATRAILAAVGAKTMPTMALRQSPFVRALERESKSAPAAGDGR